MAADRCPGVAPHVVVSETHHGRGGRSVDQWALGDGSWLMHLRFRGLAASADRSHPSHPAARIITMAVLPEGDWTLIRHGRPVTRRADQATLVAFDQSTAFDFRSHDSGSAIALHVTHARLTLSIETVHRALDNLHPKLPLYPLARTHLQHLGVIATSATPLLPDVGTTSIALMRSLLISAAGSSPGSAEPLVQQIERYIDDNLDNPRLSADVIAAAHHISARQLYRTWPTANGPLNGYITTRRLRQAHTTLLTDRHLSIAAVARRHGFAHPTHFTHRFRDLFGVSPSECRRQNAPTPKSRLRSDSE